MECLFVLAMDVLKHAVPSALRRRPARRARASLACSLQFQQPFRSYH